MFEAKKKNLARELARMKGSEIPKQIDMHNREYPGNGKVVHVDYLPIEKVTIGQVIKGLRKALRLLSKTRYFCKFDDNRSTTEWDSIIVNRVVNIWLSWGYTKETTLGEIYDDQKRRRGGHDDDKFRPKDTDEVRDVSENPQDDSEYHGGDGNSQECDHQSENPQDNGESQDQGGDGEGDNGQGCAESSQLGADNGTNNLDGGKGSRQSGNDAARSSGQAEPADKHHATDNGPITKSPQGAQCKIDMNGESHESDLDRALSLLEPHDYKGSPEASDDDFETSGDPNSLQFGGVSMSLADIDTLPPNSKRDVQRLRKSIMQLIKQSQRAAIGETPSPRIDAGYLIKEIASRRFKISRARRTEMNKKPVLLAIDVSGSCSTSCRENMLACFQLHCQDKDGIAMLIHSNGYPIEFHHRNKCVMDPYENNSWLSDEWGLVINFGDWDAWWILKQAAKQSKLVWLDSYRCNCMPPSLSLLDYEGKKMPNNITKIDGIAGIKGMIEGMNLAIKVK